MKKFILLSFACALAFAVPSWAQASATGTSCKNTVPCNRPTAGKPGAGKVAASYGPRAVDVNVRGTGNIEVGGAGKIDIYVHNNEANPASSSPSQPTDAEIQRAVQAYLNAHPNITASAVTIPSQPTESNSATSQEVASTDPAIDGKICEKRDSCGKCKKWRKAKEPSKKNLEAAWNKQFPAPTSFADLQQWRQAQSLHSLVKIQTVGLFISGIEAGAAVTTAVKGGPVANASASASSVSVAETAAAEKAATNGFGVIQ